MSRHDTAELHRDDPDLPARVMFWGTYDTGKPRTRILRAGLQARGVLVDEIHRHVWEGVEDKSQVRSPLARARLLLRWLLAYPLLAWRLMRAERADLVLVCYPGILDMFVAAPIARLRRMPVAWDLFISVYDTVCEDRRLIAPGSWSGRALLRLERAAVRRADAVFMDTKAHARRVEALFGLEPQSCGAVWVGVEHDRFAPTPTPPAMPKAVTRVLFYGQFIPLHGIGVIIEAARRLRDEPVEWLIVGSGQEAARIRAELQHDPLPRLHWMEWVDYDHLGGYLAQADLCLGIFGTSDKAASVIPNKVFQILASGRPLVTRDSEAIRELLEHHPPCSYLVPPGDGIALAETVLAHRHATSHDRPHCHAELATTIDAAAVGRQFVTFVQERLGLWKTC